MRIRYRVKLKEPILLEDHWPIPVLGGEFRVLSTENKAEAFEITFSNQSVELAPEINEHNGNGIKFEIIQREPLGSIVRSSLINALSYLKCLFDIDLSKDIQAIYEPESDDEKGRIRVTELSRSRAIPPLSVRYDLITRAIFAGESAAGPSFEATLLSAARDASVDERFIDSFRYSFLLMEFFYGGGKFRREDLKCAFKSNDEFVSMIIRATKVRIASKNNSNSDTEELLSGGPTADQVIDHIVDKRGVYFHGNLRRKDAWRPHKQQSAESLCYLALDIAMQIAFKASMPMFNEQHSERHLSYAVRAGAIMTYRVTYVYQQQGENFDRTAALDMKMPGTKPTLRTSNSVAK